MDMDYTATQSVFRQRKLTYVDQTIGKMSELFGLEM